MEFSCNPEISTPRDFKQIHKFPSWDTENDVLTLQLVC